jgi:hypothetical protein
VAGDASPANVERRGDAPRAVPCDERGGQVRIPQDGGPEDHATCPERQRGRHGPFGAEPPGDLDREPLPDGLDDPRDGLELAGRAEAGAVEVDDVQPSSAGIGERRRDGHRIVAVRGLAAEVALSEADDASITEVDRREQLEPRPLAAGRFTRPGPRFVPAR